MCLAIPVRVIAIPAPQEALIEQQGVRRTISTVLLEQVNVGDYLILHVGYALERLDPEEALATLVLMQQEGQHEERP
jgi:hydrogenase expression/formation protein HypC